MMKLSGLGGRLRCMTDSQRIAQAIRWLYETYTPEGVGLWLRGRKRSLIASPLELLDRGEVEEFVSACEGTREMVAT